MCSLLKGEVLHRNSKGRVRSSDSLAGEVKQGAITLPTYFSAKCPPLAATETTPRIRLLNFALVFHYWPSPSSTDYSTASVLVISR
jgi:hypothetical protein